ncbi:MAG: hypothetical protein J0H73_06515 [Salana multivorans]|uniref:hypothetical protein n=1 Tax=Salana multivorans TaxID=120377 RepID=UPI001ACD2F15|nr:hypothetical protein [Salana multivorans]MBN8881952.1 hypothetical protein [Salana multivorans]
MSFKLVYETVDRRALHGEPSIAEALRLSANNQGRPEVVDLPGAGAPRIGLGTEGADLLEVEGPYDIAVLTLARREQRAIRARKLGKREQVTCDLCARTFPARLVRAAHIKRRSDCNSAERADLNNVMAACALGCDELFEQGYVAVDRGGRVVASRLEIGDVQSAVEALVGRACTAYSPASARFFAYHFEESSKSDGRVP